VCVECFLVCCGVSQYVVVCWCVAVCCRVLQLESCHTCKYTRWTSAQELASNTATRCNTLQHTTTHYNTLQHTATHHDAGGHGARTCVRQRNQGCLQIAPTHCNTLHHAATRCNTLHHTAPHRPATKKIATRCPQIAPQYCSTRRVEEDVHVYAIQLEF